MAPLDSNNPSMSDKKQARAIGSAPQLEVASPKAPKVPQPKRKNETKSVSASPQKSVNQLEQNRALRSVRALHENLNMPIPKIPAVLTYLRWLNKMEAWNNRKGPLTYNEAYDNVRNSTDMYSWSGDFGNPIVLPKIKKHPDPEKYRSSQIRQSLLDVITRENQGDSKSEKHSNRATKSLNLNNRKVRHARAEYIYTVNQDPEHAVPKAKAMDPKMRQRVVFDGLYKPSSTKRLPKGDKPSKPTAFYVHAMNGFKYWPEEVYKPPVPHTKFSFGERFNPGRAGVINDRIYARPKSNKHYWTEYQLHQNPIGSGNAVVGDVLKN